MRKKGIVSIWIYATSNIYMYMYRSMKNKGVLKQLSIFIVPFCSYLIRFRGISTCCPVPTNCCSTSCCWKMMRKCGGRARRQKWPKKKRKIRRKQEEKKKRRRAKGGKKRWRKAKKRSRREGTVGGFREESRLLSRSAYPGPGHVFQLGLIGKGSKRERRTSRFAPRLWTGVHYRSRWWSWLQLPLRKHLPLSSAATIGILISVLLAAALIEEEKRPTGL